MVCRGGTKGWAARALLDTLIMHYCVSRLPLPRIGAGVMWDGACMLQQICCGCKSRCYGLRHFHVLRESCHAGISACGLAEPPRRAGFVDVVANTDFTTVRA